MAAPSVFVQLSHRLDDLCANRVEMNIADEGKEIVVLVAENGFIPIFKEVPLSAVPAVEILGIPGKKLSHDGRNAVFPASEQDVDMIVHEDPGVDSAFGVLNVLSEALKEPGFVLAIAEDV